MSIRAYSNLNTRQRVGLHSKNLETFPWHVEVNSGPISIRKRDFKFNASRCQSTDK